MKLLTLNCHSWQEEEQLEKIKYLAEVIKEKSYDVISLQEVSQSIDAEIIYDNIKKDNFVHILLEELKNLGCEDYNFYWDYSHIGYDVYEEGLALITKHPILEKQSFFISKGEDLNYWKTRKVVRLKIDYEGNNINFYSCHLGWWQDEEETFKYQADKLIEHTDKNTLAFFMGDFNNNAFLLGEGYSYLMDLGLKDCYNLAQSKDCGVTVQGEIAGWDNNSEDLRLDLILSNTSLNVKSCNVIFNDKNKNIISDHFGVEVEII